jgi:hypothetical protein
MNKKGRISSPDGEYPPPVWGLRPSRCRVQAVRPGSVFAFSKNIACFA